MNTSTDPGLKTASLAYQIARAAESFALKGSFVERTSVLDRHALELVVQVVAAGCALDDGDRLLARTNARASAVACRMAIEDARDLDEHAYLMARSALTRLVVALDEPQKPRDRLA